MVIIIIIIILRINFAFKAVVRHSTTIIDIFVFFPTNYNYVIITINSLMHHLRWIIHITLGFQKDDHILTWYKSYSLESYNITRYLHLLSMKTRARSVQIHQPHRRSSSSPDNNILNIPRRLQ